VASHGESSILKVNYNSIFARLPRSKRRCLRSLPNSHSMYSRAIAGIRGKCLIINLPGSPRGAKENLAVILPALKHVVEKIKGDDSECASP
jgi:hypothetical protein